MDNLLQERDVERCKWETRYDYGGGGKGRQRRIGDREHESSFLGSWLGFGGQLAMMRADRADRKALG